MFKLKTFAWFTIHSRSYMKGQSVRLMIGFWPAWRLFWRLTQEEKQRG